MVHLLLRRTYGDVCCRILSNLPLIVLIDRQLFYYFICLFIRCILHYLSIWTRTYELYDKTKQYAHAESRKVWNILKVSSNERTIEQCKDWMVSGSWNPWSGKTLNLPVGCLYLIHFPYATFWSESNNAALLMNSRSRNGPRLLPCGTSKVHEMLGANLNDRPVRKDWTLRTNLSARPILAYFVAVAYSVKGRLDVQVDGGAGAQATLTKADDFSEVRCCRSPWNSLEPCRSPWADVARRCCTNSIGRHANANAKQF